jgi:xanthine dehydrogenase large subunit
MNMRNPETATPLEASVTAIRGAAHAALAHESGAKHVTGAAEYVDDIPEPAGTLHLALGLTDRAHARLLALDLTVVTAAPGVAGVLTAADIPGENDVSPTTRHDDPVFATDRVEFHGQPIFAVVAATREAARRAARLAQVEYEDLPAVFDVAEALKANGPLVTEALKLERGDVARAMAAAPRRLLGTGSDRWAGPFLP